MGYYEENAPKYPYRYIEEDTMKKKLDWRDVALILICKKLDISFKHIQEKLSELQEIRDKAYDEKFGDIWEE